MAKNSTKKCLETTKQFNSCFECMQDQSLLKNIIRHFQKVKEVTKIFITCYVNNSLTQ